VVITEEQAIRLLSEANPVPDVSALDVDRAFPTARLAEYDARSTEMTKPKSDRSDSTRMPKGRRVIIGALAAVAVVAIGIVILPRMRDGAPAAGSPATPEETARAFLEAYHGRFDVDQAFTYLGADPEAVGLSTAGAPSYQLLARFFEETGSQLVDLQCEEGSASPEGTVVACTWSTHDFFSDALGLGPFGPNADELIIVDGKIVSIVDGTDEGPNEFSNQIWEPFADWIGENHPDDRNVMYNPYPNGWRITEESIPVWEQRLREYVAEVTGQQAAEDTTLGLPRLPPPGAMPSSPENGELVASMWEHEGAPGSFGNGWLYLYADGRLIWEQLDPNPNPTAGWLEQRLTAEGVEVIRSEIIASGLFDPDRPPPEPNDGLPREVNGGNIQVRNGDQLVYVNRVVPELMERLAELWSWLPDRAWEDTEAKAYVPSRYAVCTHSGFYGIPTGTAGLPSELPAAIHASLARARQLHLESLVGVDPAGFHGAEDSTEYCFDLPTEEARNLAMTLDEAGVEEPLRVQYSGSAVFYELSELLDEDSAAAGFNGITISLWPMLPHGVPAFTGA
jgi:hypothetical protein